MELFAFTRYYLDVTNSISFNPYNDLKSWHSYFADEEIITQRD